MGKTNARAVFVSFFIKVKVSDASSGKVDTLVVGWLAFWTMHCQANDKINPVLDVA